MSKRSKKITPAHVKSGRLFIITGLIVIALFGFWMFSESRYDEKYDKVEATIDEITTYMSNDARDRGDLKHSAFISYDYNGEHYDNISPNSFHSSMYEGQKLTIYLDPDKPYDPIMKASIGFFAAWIGIGTFILLIGVSIIVAYGKKGSKKLAENGRGEQIYAAVTYSGKTGTQINGQRLYRITATWDDPSGVTREFKSEYLYFDPSQYVKEGELIKVYVDPKNYKKYYMCAQELYNDNEEV